MNDGSLISPQFQTCSSISKESTFGEENRKGIEELLLLKIRERLVLKYFSFFKPVSHKTKIYCELVVVFLN